MRIISVVIAIIYSNNSYFNHASQLFIYPEHEVINSPVAMADYGGVAYKFFSRYRGWEVSFQGKGDWCGEG